MTDLFDIAKPVRDAVIAEMERSLPADTLAADRDGVRLGIHFVALLAAFGTQRHRVTNGTFEDGDLRMVLAVALGQLIANAGATFRPFRNGKPLSPTQSMLALLGEILPQALRQAGGLELGLTDISVVLKLDADGNLVPAPFDLMDMLGRGKP